MKNFIRTYGLLISILFAACFNPESGSNSMCAAVNDSIRDINISNLKSSSNKQDLQSANPELMQSVKTRVVLPGDAKDIHSNDTILHKIYKPDPTKAVWYSALCPGLGQLYNRRYWKLPLIGAGVVGITYAISWNSKYYNAYTNAYRDISDNDPKTTSYLKMPIASKYGDDISTLTTLLKNRQQVYRRTRDMSYISAVGLYLICLLDAYVDAQLYDFDISPDLTINPHPSSPGYFGVKDFELSLAFQF